MAAPSPPKGIKYAPSPWLNMPVTTYIFSFWSRSPLLENAYAPLEASSSFSDPEVSGSFKGGLGLLQIVRYHDSPVGPYDELVVVPGSFEVPGAKTKHGKQVQLPRCTRIYVSQNATLWNGRHAWNIPKHLARFSFESDAAKSNVTIRVFPPDIGTTPFFEAQLSKISYTPSFPFSTNVAKYCGIDQRLCQPPLPQEAPAAHDSPKSSDKSPLCGTEVWRVCLPEVSGSAKLCWLNLTLPKSSSKKDVASAVTETDALLGDEYDTSWVPNYRPWAAGLWIETGQISFSETHIEGLPAVQA